MREILLADGIRPDLSVNRDDQNVFIDFIHRTADGAEIYCNYGEALFQEKLYPQARNALLQVLKIAPESMFGQKAKELLGQLGGN